MQLNIDISIFSSPTKSFANVWGGVELPLAPQVGDEVSFLFMGEESMPLVDGHSSLKVTSRRFDVGREPSCSIQISDIVAEGEVAARSICKYLERQFGFNVDIY